MKNFPMALNAFLVIAVSLSHAVTNVGSWSTVASLPSKRQELPAVHYNGKIYAIGGMSQAGCCNAIGNLTEYSIKDNRWKELAKCPTAANHPGVAALDGKIYRISGWGNNSSGSAINKSCHVYDIASNKWSSIPDIPIASAAPGVVTYNGKIWVFGGSTSNGFDKNPHGNVQVYDPSSKTWNKINSNMPHPRLHIGAGLIGTKVYLSPGRDGDTDPGKNLDGHCTEFDLTKADQGAKAWREMKSKGTTSDPKSLATGYVSNWPVINGSLYYISGEPSMTTNCYRFTPDAGGGKWEQINNIPTAMHGIGPVAAGNKIYVVGGGEKRGAQVPSAKVQVLTINDEAVQAKVSRNSMRPVHAIRASANSAGKLYDLRGKAVPGISNATEGILVLKSGNITLMKIK